jgi:hypothetical protein
MVPRRTRRPPQSSPLSAGRHRPPRPEVAGAAMARLGGGPHDPPTHAGVGTRRARPVGNEAITECRECLAQAVSNAAYVLLILYDKRGDDAIRRVLDQLPDLEQVKHHPTVQRLLGTEPTSGLAANNIRTTAALLRKAQDIDALRRHAQKYPDKVVHRHLTELLLEHDHQNEARTLAERSNGANRADTAFLIRQARWHDLGRLVAEGNDEASWMLRAHLSGHHDLDDTAHRIKRHGLAPEGAVAG